MVFFVMITTMISTTVEICTDITINNLFVGWCKVVVEIISIMEIMIDFSNGWFWRRRTIWWGCNEKSWGEIIYSLLSNRMLKDYLKIFIIALGKTSNYKSIKFIRQSRPTTMAWNCLVITDMFLPWIQVKPLLSKIFKKFLRALMTSCDMKKISYRTNLVSVIPPC